MTVRKRLASAFGANLTTQAVTALVQILSVPLFLHVWTMEQYGVWLILAALPTYFALSDIGFLAATINQMAMASAAGNGARVKILFQSTLKLYLCVLLGVGVLSGVFVACMSGAPLDTHENKLALMFLVIGTVLSMTSALLDAVFRAKEEFALGTQICNFFRLAEWSGLMLGAMLGKTYLMAATGYFLTCAITALAKWKIASMRHADIRWGIKEASGEEIRGLLRPALAFSAVPLGNAISIQGMTLIVGHLFGPVFVVIFNSYRTIARIQTQVVTTVGRSVWPEASRQFGAGNIAVLRKLYMHGLLVSVALGSLTGLALLALGPTVLRLWTAGQVPYIPLLFNLFLVACVLTSLWQMGQVIISAINKHAYISTIYLAASAATLIATWMLVPLLGQYSAVMSLIGFELVLIFVCYRQINIFFRKHESFRG